MSVASGDGNLIFFFFNHQLQDLEILFSCVQKLADASAEVAFLAGRYQKIEC